MLWHVLLQFIFRLAGGVALAMAVTPCRQVVSGFFRVHLWFLLGLNTCAALFSYSIQRSAGSSHVTVTIAIVAAILCYVGSIVWLYERPWAGKAVLALVLAADWIGMASAAPWPASPEVAGVALVALDEFTSSWLLGFTLTAMLLGHWYLNTPTMKLQPLIRLLALIYGSLAARSAISGSGWVQLVVSGATLSRGLLALLAIRWIAGILGVLAMAMMTSRTLKIPNTQSATGILYVAVIFVFLGELSSLLLSAESHCPL